MTKHHQNTVAYEGCENLSSFSEDSFRRYCEAKLESCRSDVELIHQHCIGPGWAGKVCEIGSGNSKLLYSLEKDGSLQEGIGLEISRSRHEFAEAFKQWVGSTKTKNLNANLFEIDPIQECDLICALDIVLQMITPVSEDAEARLFSWINGSLKPGGYLIAQLRDFCQFIEIMNLSEDKAHPFWEEFPPADPWRYNLNRLTFVRGKDRPDILWEKTFLKRDSLETWKTQCVWRPYALKIFDDLLATHKLALVTTISERPGIFTVIAQKRCK